MIVRGFDVWHALVVLGGVGAVEKLARALAR